MGVQGENTASFLHLSIKCQNNGWDCSMGGVLYCLCMMGTIIEPSLNNMGNWETGFNDCKMLYPNESWNLLGCTNYIPLYFCQVPGPIVIWVFTNTKRFIMISFLLWCLHVDNSEWEFQKYGHWWMVVDAGWWDSHFICPFVYAKANWMRQNSFCA